MLNARLRPGSAVSKWLSAGHTPRAWKYEAGASDNVGLGMWSHELQGATTVYLDPAKKFSAATTAYLELHSNKKDQDLKVGTLLTLEGGVATIGLVNVRYLWESGGRSSLQGSTFVVGLTIARPKIN